MSGGLLKSRSPPRGRDLLRTSLSFSSDVSAPMLDFLSRLFDTTDFPARWNCGHWTSGHGWLHILSDIGIWMAYFAIPIILLVFAGKRPDVPFRKVFLLFGSFILACGTTHFLEP